MFLIVHTVIFFFFVESFLQMCFEGRWLKYRLRAETNESRSLLAVDIQGHQRGGFCIVPYIVIYFVVLGLEPFRSIIEVITVILIIIKHFIYNGRIAIDGSYLRV